MTATDPFLAEICMFPFNFAPKGWAFCNGQILPLSQNTALFSLMGTTYGGNGESNFALPDLQGRVPMHPGQGPGLSHHDLGESSGTASVTLLESEIPNHTHSANITNPLDVTIPPGVSIPAGGVPDTYSPVNSYPATFGDGELVNGKPALLYSSTNDGQMAPITSEIITNPSGGGLPHNNMQPTLFINYCIALQGVFPSRG